MKNDFCQLWLTCDDKKEATKASEVLLEKNLITCAKQIEVYSQFNWQGKMDYSDEVLLLMDSRLDLFEEVEKEITKIHSYDTFVLQAVPVLAVSKKASKWLAKELK